MIKLFLEGDYCQECPAFECECVEDELLWSDGEYFGKNFYIKCARRKQCRLIHDFILLKKKDEPK